MTDEREGPARAAGLVSKGTQTTEQLRDERFNVDQSFIARFMMWVFGGSVAATIFSIAISPLITRDWTTLVPLLLEVIKIAVVPMVALVIGYYLPKSGR